MSLTCNFTFLFFNLVRPDEPVSQQSVIVDVEARKKKAVRYSCVLRVFIDFLSIMTFYQK